ncbi:protein of unknown function (plasmid) [Cupriavidus taiwanensis]|uniref:Transposase n=1 Tax=Cupriavidus taiwanensis TaxID=164546 RepID=A0A375IU26_9BURK|nr:protein of unknown function [Cupriavidus taiwanensis]
MYRYTEQFRLSVIKEYLGGQVGASTLAKRHGIDDGTVRRWVAAYRLHGKASLKRRYKTYSAEFKLSVLERMRRQGFHTENFAIGNSWAFVPYGWSAVLTAVPTSGIVFSFNGFQSPVSLAGEARNPSRSIPFAVVGSILLALVIYALLQLAFIGAVSPASIRGGWSHLDFTSPFA